ncbi:MAG: hypothetical protein K6B41_00230 [Butyrivibrio sp.]|nr:hypothetical protein [Butyrivibrio sp.]
MKKLIVMALMLICMEGVFTGCAGSDDTSNDNYEGVATSEKTDADDNIENTETNGGKVTAETEDGAISGKVTKSEADGPKTIESTEITSFECWFSTADFTEPGSLGNHIYEMKASLDGDVVTGSYKVIDEGKEYEFTAGDEFDGGFMGELYTLIDSYNIAENNGFYENVSGIPEEFGAKINVDFESGEKIIANSNSDNYLNVDFMSELISLFERGVAKTPETLDFSVKSEFVMKEFGDNFGSITYPVYTFGYYTSDGELQQPDGYQDLAKAIDEINSEHAESADDAWNRFDTTSTGNIYNDTVSYVTRCDSKVVSFYERTKSIESDDQQNEYTKIQTYNFDSETGEKLGFSDVFKDIEYLGTLILSEFEKAYPDIDFVDDADSYISDSILYDDGEISFSLGQGCVHIFANEYAITCYPGSPHITLSYAANPGLVKAFYEKGAEEYLIPMDYDTTYWRSDSSIGFKMHCDFDAGSDSADWKVSFEGSDAEDYEESFFGYAPSCYLAHVNGRDFIYLRVPTGDVAMFTNVYELTSEGVTLCTDEPVSLAIYEQTLLDPESMSMSLDKIIYSMAGYMIPRTLYSIGEDGLPERRSDVYELDGTWVRLRQSGRYNPDNEKNAAVSGGMWNLVEGQRMRPYQTDMESYIDYITDDYRVVRFEINEFSYEMQLDSWGTLDDVFMSDEDDTFIGD